MQVTVVSGEDQNSIWLAAPLPRKPYPGPEPEKNLAMNALETSLTVLVFSQKAIV